VLHMAKRLKSKALYPPRSAANKKSAKLKTRGADEVQTAVVADNFLSAYVERLASKNFTRKARSAMLTDIKEYSNNLKITAEAYQRADRNAERTLKSHVVDAAALLRRQQEPAYRVVADWCKWIGFAFLGFTVEQFLRVQGEKVILRGSVNWLIAEAAITITLITAGFAIDRPLSGLSRKFRKRD
jgi:hypothetical protein